MHALFVVLLFGLVWWPWRRLNKTLYGDAFSPFNLLFYFWTGPFILSFANLSALQTAMGAGPVAIVLLSTAVLMATSLLPAMMLARTTSPRFGLPGGRSPVVRPAPIMIFLGITLLALYFAEFSGRDLPLILYLLGGVSDSNLNTAGKDSKLQVVAFGIYAVAIFLFYLWLNEPRGLRRILYLMLSLMIVALGLVKTSKSDIYIPVLSYGALTYYHYRAQNRSLPSRYAVLALLTAPLVIAVTSIRLEGVGLRGGYAGLIDFRYSNEIGDVASEVVSIAYGYTSLGFQNFCNYVNSHAFQFRIGASLFRPLLSAFMMGDVANAIGVPVDEWNVVSDAANTGTFLTPLYIEGGFLFCVLGAFLYGLIVNLTYYRFRSTRSILWRFMYISLLFPWTWMFFTNAFSVLSIYVNLFYVSVLSWLSISKAMHYSRRIPLRRRAMLLESDGSGS